MELTSYKGLTSYKVSLDNEITISYDFFNLCLLSLHFHNFPKDIMDIFLNMCIYFQIVSSNAFSAFITLFSSSSFLVYSLKTLNVNLAHFRWNCIKLVVAKIVLE